MKIFLLTLTVLLITLSTQTFASTSDLPKDSVLQNICKPDEAYFQAITTREMMLLGKTYEGKDVVVQLTLFIESSGLYYAEYRELKVEYKSPTGSGGYFKLLYSSTLKGNWMINNSGEMVLDNLGTASGTIYHGEEEILNLSFTHAIHDLGVVGKQIQLSFGFENGRWVGSTGKCLKK